MSETVFENIDSIASNNYTATVNSLLEYCHKLNDAVVRMVNVEGTFVVSLQQYIDDYNTNVKLAEEERRNEQSERAEETKHRTNANVAYNKANDYITNHWNGQHVYKNPVNNSDCNCIELANDQREISNYEGGQANIYKGNADTHKYYERMYIWQANNAYSNIEATVSAYIMGINAIDIPQFQEPSNQTDYVIYTADSIKEVLQSAWYRADAVYRKYSGPLKNIILLDGAPEYQGEEDLRNKTGEEFKGLRKNFFEQRKTFADSFYNSYTSTKNIIESYFNEFDSIESDNSGENFETNNSSTSFSSNSARVEIGGYKIEDFNNNTFFFRDASGKDVYIKLDNNGNIVLDSLAGTELFGKIPPNSSVSLTQFISLATDNGFRLVVNRNMDDYLKELYNSGARGRVELVVNQFPTIGSTSFIDLDKYMATGIVELYASKEDGTVIRRFNPNDPTTSYADLGIVATGTVIGGIYEKAREVLNLSLTDSSNKKNVVFSNPNGTIAFNVTVYSDGSIYKEGLPVQFQDENIRNIDELLEKAEQLGYIPTSIVDSSRVYFQYDTENMKFIETPNQPIINETTGRITNVYLDGLVNNGFQGRVRISSEEFPTIGNICYVDLDEYKRSGTINLYTNQYGGDPIRRYTAEDNLSVLDLSKIIQQPKFNLDEVYTKVQNVLQLNTNASNYKIITFSDSVGSPIFNVKVFAGGSVDVSSLPIGLQDKTNIDSLLKSTKNLGYIPTNIVDSSKVYFQYDTKNMKFIEI